MKRLLMVICVAAVAAPVDLSAAGFDRAAFAEPDNVFAPAFFWFWNNHLDKDRLCAEVDDMADHGAKSICIHPFPKGFRPRIQPSDMEPDWSMTISMATTSTRRRC